MIQITIKRQQKKIKKICVCGHAGSDEFGKDLVCAGVSCIVSGMMNAIDLFMKDTCDLLVEKNEMQFLILNENKEVQIILEAMIIQLKTVQELNKRNIKFIELEDIS